MTLRSADAVALEGCIAGGAIAVIPTDTVYGIACDPSARRAIARIYELKGRPSARPAAVMFFALEEALAALGELEEPERAAAGALLPGPVTLLLANSARRFPLACGPKPETLGLRVPRLAPALEALSGVRGAILQTSANLSGGPDCRRLSDVPESLRKAAGLLLNAGELPGVASSVVDLASERRRRRWMLLREGALDASVIEGKLAAAGWIRERS